MPARELVAALEAIHAGEVVISPDPGKSRPEVGLDWPGRTEGLTNRESEILALITQGKTNTELAELMYLSNNIDQDLHPLGLPQDRRHARTRAVLWGIEHGFQPDHHRIDHWRGGP